VNNGPYGPPPPGGNPYQDPNQPPAAPLAPSSYGYGPPGGSPNDDTIAWASIVCSGLGWVSCCCGPIPFLGILAGFGGLALSVAGVICGYLALQKAKQNNGRTDLPMIGIVLGAVRLGLVVVGLVIVVGMVVLGVGVGVLEGITHPQ
jgi:hypothetical protein